MPATERRRAALRLILVHAALMATAPRAVLAAAPAPPCLLLVTIDTLRPDALGWVSGRNDTPVIDALAREGFRFPAALTPAPLTGPAHASLLTALLPRHHGVRDNGQTLAATANLGQGLRARGYATAAFVSGYPLQSVFGLNRGFDHYDDTLPHGSEGWVERRAVETTDAALAWIRGARRPWFAWVHYYDPHDPYEPPRAFWRPGPRGAYDGEVSYVDHALGRLLQGSSALPRSDRLTVLTADHGEGLGDHDEHTHGYFVYDSTVRVPLVFHWPGRVKAGESRRPARLIDVAPTLLELLGAPPLEKVDGVSLVPTLQGKDQEIPDAYVETYLPWIYFGWSPLKALSGGGFKLIAAPRPELYDLAADPLERTNLGPDHAQARRLSRAMVEIEAAGAKPSTPLADPEALERLRALGYVGAGGRVAEPPPGLPDPKDRIQERDRLNEAERILRRGDLAGALDAFEAVLAREPDNRFATLRSGVALLKLGRVEAAVERLSRAVALDPERAEAHYALADALTRARSYRRAAQEWAEMARLQPGKAEAWFNLGLALLEDGHATQAVAACERAAEIRPGDAKILTGLGRAERAAGRPGSAIRHLQEAARLAPQGTFSAPGALGLLLVKQGRPGEARSWLASSPKTDTDFAEARLELARIEAGSGRTEAARTALAEALGAKPALRAEAARDARLAPLLP